MQHLVDDIPVPLEERVIHRSVEHLLPAEVDLVVHLQTNRLVIIWKL